MKSTTSIIKQKCISQLYSKVFLYFRVLLTTALVLLLSGFITCGSALEIGLKDLSTECESGKWKYSISENGYFAILTGYEGEETEIIVPVSIDGIDVGGIASRTFLSTGIEKIIIHGNVVWIAEDAIPMSNPMIEAPNASAGLKFAQEHGWKYLNTSPYDFEKGVVDYSAAPSGHVSRYSYSYVEMNYLESLRIEPGDYFWMIDNHQVEFYYQVISKQVLDNGRVGVNVEVPDISLIVKNMRLSNDVVISNTGYQAYPGGTLKKSRAVDYFQTSEMESDPITFDLGSCELQWLASENSSLSDKISGKVKINVIESYTMGMEDNELVYLEMQEVIKGTVELTVSMTGSWGDDNALEDVLDNPLQVKLSPPIGIPVMEAGLFSLDIEPSFTLQLSGSVKGTFNFYSYQTKKYDFAREEWIIIDKFSQAKPAEDSVKVKCALELKAGVSVEVSAKFFKAIKVFSVEIEAGIKAVLSYEFTNITDNALFAGDPCISLEIYGFAGLTIKVVNVTIFEKEFTTKDDMYPPFAICIHISPQYGVHWAKECPANSLVKVEYLTRINHYYDPVYIEPGTSLSEEYNYSPSPTATSGRLLGWSDNPNTREPNVVFGENGTVFEHSVVLYAVWENTVEVQFDSGAEDVTVLSQYVPVGGFVADPGSPEQEGNLFRYWYVLRGEDQIERWIFNSDTVPSEGLILHGSWYGSTDYTGGTTAAAYIGREFSFDNTGFDDSGYSYSVIAYIDDEPLAVELTGHDGDSPYVVVPQQYRVQYTKNNQVHEKIVPVAAVSNGIFQGHDSLLGVKFDYTGHVDITMMFYGDNRLQYVDLSRASLKDGEIGDQAFNGCLDLQGIKVSRGLRSIGEFAFYGCRLQCMFELPDGITSIEQGAFSTSKVAGITIPEGIDEISPSLFENCTNLYTVKLPNSVKHISANAFNGCKNLCFTVEFPNGLESIGDNAFNGCRGLTRIELPDTVYSLGQDVFDGTDLMYLKWTAGIPVVPDAYFYGSDDPAQFNALKTLILPEGVTKINELHYSEMGAFQNTPLETISLPSTLKTIGRSAFEGCTSLKNIQYPNGNNIEQIEANAFRNCGGALEEVAFGNSLAGIGSGAFENCTAVKKITFGNGSTVIEDVSFKNCSSLEEIICPTENAIKEIGSHAFEGCSALSALEISNGLEKIGQYAFYECSGLTRVILPDTVTEIEQNAFDSTGLEYLKWTAGIPVVPDAYFYGSENDPAQFNALKTLILPEGVTKINELHYSEMGAFQNTPLETISLPSTLKMIGRSAFEGCTSLKEIYYYGTAENWRVLSIDNGNESLFRATIRCNFNPDMVLPIGLISIEDEAFATIQNKVIQIPESLTYLSNTAFDESVILLCTPGTISEALCKQNGFAVFSLFIP